MTGAQQILFNLALLDTINFCKAKEIDCSGSHLVKDGRGYKYNLVKSDTKKILVTVTFVKYGVPVHSYFKC